MDAPTSILHVTESYAGGVAAAIKDYSLSVPEVRHHIIFAPRSEAPIGEDTLAGFASARALPPSHTSRVRTIRVAIQSGEFDVVHAHSSYAGVYVRLAAGRSGPVRIVYTPHCFAFERRDVSAMRRFLFRAAERVLARRTSVFAACSPREASLSASLGAGSEVVYVPNIAPITRADLSPGHAETLETLAIVGAGRLSAQKDPDFFLAAVNAAREGGIAVEATWVGGGDARSEAALIAEDVRVTGWLGRQQVLLELARADVYLHSAEWEGFPIAILEADALGVPTVVRRTPALEGISMPAQIEGPEDFRDLARRLLSAHARDELTRGVREALSCNTRGSQRHALQIAWGLPTHNKST